MAYTNFDGSLIFPSGQGQVSNLSMFSSMNANIYTYGLNNLPSGLSSFITVYDDYYIQGLNLSVGDDYYIIGDSTLGLSFHRGSGTSWYNMSIRVWENGNYDTVCNFPVDFTHRYDFWLCPYCGIDETNQTASLFFCRFSGSNDEYATGSAWGTLNNSKVYHLFMQYHVITYNWQSVVSLTGKGKTVQLSTLNDINDGEEVITDDTSKFNLTNESNTLTLVRNNLPN